MLLISSPAAVISPPPGGGRMSTGARAYEEDEIRLGTIGRVAAELFFEEQLKIRWLLNHGLPLTSRHLQVNRPGRSGCCHSERLTEKIGQAVRAIYASVELGDRPEHGKVLDHLREVPVSEVGGGGRGYEGGSCVSRRFWHRRTLA